MRCGIGAIFTKYFKNSKSTLDLYLIFNPKIDKIIVNWTQNFVPVASLIHHFCFDFLFKTSFSNILYFQVLTSTTLYGRQLFLSQFLVIKPSSSLYQDTFVRVIICQKINFFKKDNFCKEKLLQNVAEQQKTFLQSTNLI